MKKGKKYPYMKRKKQINVYLSNEMWKDIEDLLDKDYHESRNQFIKRALITEIMTRRKSKELGEKTK